MAARSHKRPLHEWCALAGVPCRASGAWTERLIAVRAGAEEALIVMSGSCGAVQITTPRSGLVTQARYVVGLLAYGLNDLVARETIRGAPWAKLRPPKGRPRSARALTNVERQRRYRLRGRD